MSDIKPQITICITGNSHAGKTLITAKIAEVLKAEGINDVSIVNLDGDIKVKMDKIKEEGPGALGRLIERPPSVKLIDVNSPPHYTTSGFERIVKA